MNAACPPLFCASAITCSASVVLPPDSGPKTSTTRPRGNPPTPRAASIESAPVGITLTGPTTSLLPKRVIEPLPYCFSICAMADSSTLVFSSAMSHLDGKNQTAGDDLHIKFYQRVAELCACLSLERRKRKEIRRPLGSNPPGPRDPSAA